MSKVTAEEFQALKFQHVSTYQLKGLFSEFDEIPSGVVGLLYEFDGHETSLMQVTEQIRQDMWRVQKGIDEGASVTEMSSNKFARYQELLVTRNQMAGQFRLAASLLKGQE